jgi:hypothetical protein
MAIAANISTELVALQAQIDAARPLKQASRATVQAIKLNAGQLLSDVQTTLVAESTLDTWSAPTDPAAIAQGVLDVATASTDQSNLALLRGQVGRAVSNLSQVPS